MFILFNIIELLMVIVIVKVLYEWYFGCFDDFCIFIDVLVIK